MKTPENSINGAQIPNLDLQPIVALGQSLQAKLQDAGVSIGNVNGSVSSVIDGITAIHDALRDRVAADPKQKEGYEKAEVLEQLTTTAEFLGRLHQTPPDQLVTDGGESVHLLRESVASLVSKLCEQTREVAFVAHSTSEELLDELYRLPTAARGTKPKKMVKKKEKDDDDWLKRHQSVFDNQSSGNSEKYEKKEISPLWRDFLKKQMLPIMPYVYVHGRIFDMHEIYERIAGQDADCWTEFEVDEHDAKHFGMHRMMIHEMMMHERGVRRDEYTDEDSFLPAISYSGKELKNGIPFIPGFAPYKVEVSGKKIAIERSTFGFFRLKDASVTDGDNPIRVVYSPAHSLHYEDEKDEVKLKKEAFFTALQVVRPMPQAPLPTEVQEEVTCPGKGVSWEKQLTQMIIALNLGYSKPETFLTFDKHVGPYLSDHLAGRRMGTCLHSTAIVSDMLTQLGKPNFITMGRFVDKQEGHVEVWQYLPKYGRTLRIDPTLFASQLKKEHEEAVAEFGSPEGDCSDDEAAFALGEQVRAALPPIPHQTGPDYSYDEYLFDRGSGKHGMHMHMMMHEIGRSSDSMLWNRGAIPLRTALTKCVDRYKDGRCDELLKLYFKRKKEIEDKIAYRVESGSELPKGPADIALGLVAAAFRNDEVHVLDLEARYKQGKYENYRDSDPMGLMLLKCPDEELEKLGTSRNAVLSLLRRSPAVINTVLKAKRGSYLTDEQNRKKYVAKPSVKDVLVDAELLLSVLTEEALAEYNPEHEPNHQVALRDLCVSLVEIYALSKKLRDSALADRVRVAWRALGNSFKHIPQSIDLHIFKRLSTSADADTTEGFLTCINELESANAIFGQIFERDEAGNLKLSIAGTERFAAEWDVKNSKSEHIHEDFCSSVDYLHFLHQQDMTTPEGIETLGDVAKGVLVKDILQDWYKINPPIDAYPISQLMLLDQSESHGRRSRRREESIPDALLMLREIGVINDNHRSKEGDELEEALSKQIADTENCDCDTSGGGQLYYNFGEKGKWGRKNRLSIPLEALAYTIPQLRKHFSPSGLSFVRHHNDLNFTYTDRDGWSSNERRHYSSQSPSAVASERALISWREKYGESFAELVRQVDALEHEDVFWDRKKSLRQHCALSDQAPEVQLAGAVMQLGLMERRMLGKLQNGDMKREVKGLRKRVYDRINTDGEWGDDDAPHKLDVSDSYLSNGCATSSHVPQFQDQIPLVIASGDASWFKNVSSAIGNIEACNTFIQHDTCAGVPHGLSAQEKSLRTLLATESKILESSLDVNSIKRMAKKIAMELKKKSPLIVSGTKQNGEQRGNRRSWDRTADFSHFQEMTIPEAHKIDWKAWAKTDRFYERRTVSAENRGETVIINIGKVRTLAEKTNDSNYSPSPTACLGSLLKMLQDHGRVNEHTRFAIQTHGIGVAYFSLSELMNGSVPLLQLCSKANELDTPLERLIAILILSHKLGNAPSLSSFKEQNSLFELTADRMRFHGQKLVLVTETDSASDDIAQVLPLAKNGDLSVYRCNNDTHEVSF